MKKLIMILVLLFLGCFSNIAFNKAYATKKSSNSEMSINKVSVFSPPSRSNPPPRNRTPIQRSRRARATKMQGWEVGFNLGTSHSLTEIGGSKDVSRGFIFDTQFETTSINFGVFGKYRFNNFISASAAFNYGHIHGADSLSPIESPRYARGFSFENNIYELSVRGEAYTPRFFAFMPLDFFGYIGVAGFNHDPLLRMPEPEQYEFEDFNNFAVAFPLGLGATYTIYGNFKISLDIGWRKTFTKYLNGFTRPASQGYNSYYFTALKFSYAFDDGQRMHSKFR